MCSVGMAMQIVYLWITITFLLQKHCIAKELPCTVKESKGLTTYIVPKYNSTGCEVFLKHPNGKNLKHLDPENEMKEQSEWTFASEVCYKQLNFSCTCLSETEHNKAICRTDCSKHGRKESVGDRPEMKNDPPKSANDNVTPYHHWTLMGSGILFVLVLLLLLLLAFCYKDHNSRCTSESGSNDSAFVIV